MAPKKRIPQTASLRRRQSARLANNRPSKSVVSSPQEIILDEDVNGSEEEAGDVVAIQETGQVDSDIDHDSLKGPFPGGPERNELLVDYRHHIAYRVWNGKVPIINFYVFILSEN
ncbi:hypothetical protein QJS10_CPA08g01592 [Acorus calamus]|uniref:Uncharacterized protein n=1 Tax=Acorus calamus TaxID=4465 RepID=A0AAV9EAN2_ACOCL|nr:hypothetical protein QJS10_CPA08g01592 [Acorus calamus]